MSATAFILFLAIVALTLVITYFAAKQTKTANEFYTAGGGLTGIQKPEPLKTKCHKNHHNRKRQFAGRMKDVR